MIDFKLNPHLHKTDVSTSVLYHGSPIRIDDRYMASGTFFTVDKNIARDYGKFIYSIELDEKIASIFHPDSLREHLVSCRLIPMFMFNVQECP
jgi:hypothetical protein